MCEAKSLVIGKITKPQGLKGEVRMHYYGNDPDSLVGLKDARIVKSNGDKIDIKIKRIRRAKNILILSFNGVDSIEDAQILTGSLVHVKRTDLTKLEDNEYYQEDIIGIQVYNESGELIGTLDSVFETGSNDVYVVKRGKKEILIPAISQVIKEVDIAKKTMRVHLLEGMRDDF